LNRDGKVHIQDQPISVAVLHSEACLVKRQLKTSPSKGEVETAQIHEMGCCFKTPGQRHHNIKPVFTHVAESLEVSEFGDSMPSPKVLNVLPNIPQRKSPTWTWGRVVCSSMWKSLVSRRGKRRGKLI
jgi:hypothetical protein